METITIYDDMLARNIILVLLVTLIVLLIHIAVCVYIYISSKKYPDSNGILWFIINLFFPPIGLIGYAINRTFIKNISKNTNSLS